MPPEALREDVDLLQPGLQPELAARKLAGGFEDGGFDGSGG